MKKIVFLLLALLLCCGFCACDKEETGVSWLSGKGVPKADLGNAGDFFVSSNTFEVYQKADTEWKLLGNVKEKKAKATLCETGTYWHTGWVAPDNTVGSDGDWFVNVKNHHLYIKENGAWQLLRNIGEVIDLKQEYKILFIGNSYTYYNDMPDIVQLIATKAGYNVTVEHVTKGGWTLEKQADPADEVGAKVAEKLDPKNYGKYDYVILQEQSHRPITNTPSFYDATRNLVGRIRAVGATPVLYATWGRKTGSGTLATYNLTNETMTYKLNAAYRAIGEELGVTVSHVGLAFYDVYTNKPGIDLYNKDLSHSSYEGSFLAAATLFATVFGADPTTVDYVGSCSAEAASVLMAAAKNATVNTPALPEEYKTSSVGVTAAK